MSEPSASVTGPLASALARRVDAACDRFESAWRAGRRPRIEEILGDFPESARPALLRELLGVELVYRRLAGETPDPEEYRPRFPDHPAEIRDALEAASTSPDGIDRPPTTGDGAAREASPGALRARYRILRPHARGGLGEVYLARDQQLGRVVALKEIQASQADCAGSRARFMREAEITGGLEHPGIVPVYELGRHGDGRPYYAMRFIEGDSLKEAIDRHHAEDRGRAPGGRTLKLRDLLGRFVGACNAVAYAHSRGVIHRDLKPANIMLGPFGETLVVDWGLAKPSAAPEPARSRDEGPRPWAADGEESTLPGVPLGTPQYMSPEQAAGEPGKVGPASDVYGLGATLYCLLTGRPPFEDRDVTTVLQRVVRGDFPPPRQVRRDVPHALEAICLKAMAARAEDRYESVRSLADDVERWLAGEAVSAWREPWSVRARRRLARHRTLATSAAAATLAAIAGLAAIAVLQARSNRQLDAKNRDLSAAKDRAEARVDLAVRAIENFRKAVRENVDVKNRPELAPLRKTLLSAPQEFYRELRGDIEASGEARPEARAQLAKAILGLAAITEQLDSVPNAIQSYREAIDVLTPLVRDRPAAAEYQSDLAYAHYELAKQHRSTGRPAAARADVERARDLLEALVHDRPADVAYRVRLAGALNSLGVLHADAQRPLEAREEYERAMEILKPVARDRPADVSYRRTASALYNNLGMVLRDTGRKAEAPVEFQRACDLEETVVRDRPADAESRSQLAAFHFNLGELRGELGRKAEASGNYERARDLWTGLARDFPSVTQYRGDLARSYGLWGYLQWREGRLDEARKNLEISSEMREGLVREHPNLPLHRSGVGWSRMRLGQVHRDAGRLVEARADLGRACDALEVAVRINPGDHWSRNILGIAYSNLGGVLARLGQDREALAVYRRAIEHQRRSFESNTANKDYREGLSDHYLGLAALLRKVGRPGEAAAATLDRQRLWPDSPDELYHSALDLAECVPLVAKGRGELTREERTECRRYADQALDALRRAIAAGLLATPPPTTPDLDSPRARAMFPALVRDAAFPDNPFAR
jgi:serine/threonine-protein kinase